ncbi:transmembrane protein 144-like isoform X1 [Ruditapes philippinarum]|uniref:transmembrane protein 144-like isoform X1 n=1 Tax=Ruditapes philippinarum TaxID=129788 RepID=UPI00295AD738|nr:transmembrane protein 144-like isoform X1 [Ruditapes philippinarum]
MTSLSVISMATSDITNATTISHDITTAACQHSDIPFYWGFITAAIAIFFYGTNFAPVKKFDTGDGMFFQWILCMAIWCSGLVVQMIRKSPKFYPLAMLGGLLWETGNICVVPIIKTIGLGLGLCIWGMTNLLSGWATGRFGMFGLHADPPDNKVLNDIGVILAVSSAVIFAMVKNEVSTAGVDQTVTVDISSERNPLLENGRRNGPTYSSVHTDDHDVIIFNNDRPRVNSINQVTSDSTDNDVTFIDRLSPATKRIVGIVLSAVSGIFYGQMFTPAIYVQDNYDGASQEALDYVFATFSGILATSTVYFLIYAAFSGNKPKVYPRAILPGFVSGLMWGVATSSWFVANKVLSESVAFPIVTTGPGVIASILGVVVFREIQGRKNILILLLGMTVTITGSVLAGLSKKAAKQC